MAALTKKRFLTFRREKKMWAFVVFMPALFVLGGVLIMQFETMFSEPSLLVLSPTVGCRMFFSGRNKEGAGEGRAGGGR